MTGGAAVPFDLLQRVKDLLGIDVLLDLLGGLFVDRHVELLGDPVDDRRDLGQFVLGQQADMQGEVVAGVGALLALLTEFAVRGVNLSRIESRPTGGRLGQYFFSLDCDGHLADERVGEALSALYRVCAQVRVLGSWARADGVSTPLGPGTSDADFRDAAAWLARLRDGA